ncbi:MAG: polysaccharide pyruvyl transferase CsaB [Armatimonadetes bacterium]|nr:polysaccharide pyruvyl transferase CsaB [Armatimonadota bacterium]
MPQVFLFGYFGAGNFGDEWTLASFIKGCQRFGLSRKQLVVLSRNPQRTSNEHDVAAIPRNWRSILSTVRESHSVIGCGGSLLQDVTSFRSLAFYCLLIWVAKAMGKKVALLGQGLGPLKRTLSRKLAKRTLNACDLVTFREEVSFETAKQIGVQIDDCFVTADLTFVWDDLPQREREAEFGVNIRPLKGRWNEETIGEALKKLLCEGENVLLLPLQPQSDELVLKTLAASLPSKWWRYESWRDGLEGISSIGLLIAMRLHALVAACLLGVPFVGLNYDPKVANIFGKVAGREILPLSASSEELAETIGRVRSEDSEAMKLRLSEFVSNQRLAAMRNFELMANKLLS